MAKAGTFLNYGEIATTFDCRPMQNRVVCGPPLLDTQVKRGSRSRVFALLNTPLISSALQFSTVWVFIFTASNENSTLFMASPDIHMLTYPHLCRVWSMPSRSTILFAWIQEQPLLRQLFVHKTGELEWKCWLLFVGRSNLQRGTCCRSLPQQQSRSTWQFK